MLSERKADILLVAVVSVRARGLWGKKSVLEA